MKRIYFIIFLLSLNGFLSIQSSVQAEEFNVWDESHWVQADYNWEFPYASAVRLSVNSSCSGAVVGKDYVLTAGHCNRSEKVVLNYGGNKASFGIDKARSYYNPRSGSFGDYALIKLYTAKFNGKKVHIGDLRKPLTLWGKEEIKTALKRNGTTAIVGFPARQPQRQIKVSIYGFSQKSYKDSSGLKRTGYNMTGTFNGGGRGLSGSPLLNQEGQIMGVYHGTNSGDAKAAQVEIEVLKNNTSIGNETSRLYVWKDKATYDQKKKEINPEGVYIEGKNTEAISTKDLFALADKSTQPGEKVIGLTDGIRTFNQDSTINMPIGGANLYPVTIKKTWGEVPWDFDQSTGILTFTGGGSLAAEGESPWKRNDALKIDASKIKRIVFTQEVKAPINSNQLFGQVGQSDDAKAKRLSKLEAIENLNYLDTSEVTDMSYMFAYSGAAHLNVGTFNTSKVTTMHMMFGNNPNLSELDISNFNLSKVEQLSQFVSYDSNLAKLVMPSASTTSNLKSTYRMLIGNSKLKQIDLSGLDTTSVTDMREMLSGLDRLSSITLGSQTILNSTCDLPDIEKANNYTGNWIQALSPYKGMGTSSQLTSNYDGSFPGKYIKEKNEQITFDANGGATSQEPILGTTFKEVNLKNLAKAERSGYEFLGWFTDAIGGTRIPETVVIPEGGVTYYAHWATVEETETKEVTQSIHYNYSDGTKALEDHKASIVFNRNVFIDPDTENKVYADWTSKGETVFPSVSSPTIAGYNPSQKEVSAVSHVTGDSENIDIEVVYTTSQEKATVTYIDDTKGQVLYVTHLSGAYGTIDDYRTQPSIATYTSLGYQFISDTYPSDGVKYNQVGKEQHFEVHLRYTGENRVETKTVQRRIQYKYSSGTEALQDFMETLPFARVITKNEATGQSEYGEWQPLEGKQSFEPVNSPSIIGYTPDQLVLDRIDSITGDSNDINQAVIYSGNLEYAQVNYIDDTTGETLNVEQLSGTHGTIDNYRTDEKIKHYVELGYKLFSNDYPSDGVVYDQARTKKVFNVHFKHDTTVTVESQSIKQVIHYNYLDGSKALEDYNAQLIFKRKIILDKVLGTVTYGEWSPVNGTHFRAVDSPHISGFKADKASISIISGVTATMKNMEFFVTYIKQEESKTNESGGRETKKPENQSNIKSNEIIKEVHDEDPKKPPLPRTGERNTLGLVLLGCMLIGTIFVLLVKKK